MMVLLRMGERFLARRRRGFINSEVDAVDEKYCRVPQGTLLNGLESVLMILMLRRVYRALLD